MDFALFDQQIKKVSSLILADHFRPDIIIGIARGGWIPARIFSKYLGTKKLLSCGMTYTDSTRTTMSLYQPIGLPADAHNILIVEDFLESGKSIQYVADDLAADKIDVRTAAVGYLEKTILVPTYSLGCVTETPQLPWD